MIRWIFNGKAQIGYNRTNKSFWGYHDQYKEDGISEEGVYIKFFGLGKAWICWCPWEVYRVKYLYK